MCDGVSITIEFQAWSWHFGFSQNTLCTGSLDFRMNTFLAESCNYFKPSEEEFLF